MKNKIKIVLLIELLIFLFCFLGSIIGGLLDTTKYEFIHYLKVFAIAVGVGNVSIIVAILLVLSYGFFEYLLKELFITNDNQ